VQLHEGTYHTAQIVVNEFQGEFSGAGVDETMVLNLPHLYVAEEYYLNAPSPENPFALFFTFVGGDFSISGMSIHIVGDEPTQDWWVGDFGPLYEMACAVCILGTEAHAEIHHVSVEGEVKENSIFGYNLGNGIFFQGWMEWIDPSYLPNSGSFSVHHSTFRNATWGSPIAYLTDATVTISHNNYENVLIAMDGGGLVNTTLEFSHNKVEGGYLGLDFYDFIVPEYTNSEFLIKNNTFQGSIGIAFEQTFGEGNQCLLLGNNVQNVTDIGIFLGPGTYGCTVVGGNNKTNVIDLGTDNILTGVNNMGTGVGPTIQHFMRP